MASYTVGRITGIPIKLHVTLLVFLPLLVFFISRPDTIAAYADLIAAISQHEVAPEAVQEGNTPWLIGVAGAVALFVGVLLHELGHSWTARYFDIGIASITLWIFGGMARMEDLPEEWRIEFWVALAGPVTSVLIAAVCYAALLLVPTELTLVVFLLGFLAVLNLVLAVFNMLPAFPMDGGRIFRALLARSRPYSEATRTAASVGQGFAVAMAILGLLWWAPMLLLVAMFVYVAAGSESRTTVIRDLLRDVTVADLLDEELRTAHPEEGLGDLLDRMFAERRTGYPVVEGGTLVGLVTLANARGRNRDPDAVTVGDVMLREPPTVGPEANAFEVLRLLSTGRGDRVVVVDDGAVLGVVGEAELITALEVMQGLGDVRRPELTPEGYA